jgi:uncharacterized protein YggE
LSTPPDNIEGFTVAGKATVDAKPNAVEIDLEVSAASELTADAIVKYRDAKKRLHEAFNGLKLSNVTVEERGLAVDQRNQQMPYYWGGFPQNQRAKTEVQLARKLVVKASDVRKLDEDALLQLVAKLLDVAQDAGARVGPGQPDFNPYYYRYSPFQTGLVRFVVDDFDALQEDAYAKAVADARARAERLAKLSRVELGPVVAVREVIVPGERPGGTEEENRPKRIETMKLQPIPIRVELLVRFAVNAKAEPKARTGG